MSHLNRIIALVGTIVQDSRSVASSPFAAGRLWPLRFGSG